MTITDREVKLYTRIIDRTLARYRSHPQYEDLRVVAMVAVWKALVAAPEDTLDRHGGLIVQHTLWAAHGFFDSPENELRRYHRKNGRLTEIVFSLNYLQLAEEDLVPWAGGVGSLPCAPDFVPALIERLWREWLWQETFAALDGAEATAARDYLEGRSFKEQAREQGCHWMTTRRQAQRGLNRMRRRFGQAELADGRVDRRLRKEKQDDGCVSR